MTRVVLDTNVFVSAVLGKQLRPILTAWYAGRLTLLVTEPIVAEYLKVLQRPKFTLSGEIIEALTAYLFHSAEFVIPQERIQAVQADPTDDIFIEAAVAGAANWIVSGDKAHLLPLGEFRQIPIVSPHQFIDWLAQQEDR